MTDKEYYRGGTSLIPRRTEVRVERTTGLVRPVRGISVYDRPDHPRLAQFGGAYRVVFLPPGLHVVQIGDDSSHHEIPPAALVTWDEYVRLVGQIVLAPA